jgi:ribosome-binding factor A
VYVSVFGGPAAQAQSMKMLEAEKQHIRGLVASRLTMKFIPALQFFLDDTLDHVDRINTLIKKIHDDADNSGGQSGT